jgi:arginine/lysine/ornithine decarboxylase
MLYGLLSEYNKKNVVPMHMPGHKRNTAMLGDGLPYGIDVTEIDGFDNLHDARGVLKETADLASRLYGSRRAFLLVNGSTGGILAGVRSAVRYGGTVIMARNCHISVYNAAELCGLKPAYLLPDIDEASGICGSVRPEQVEKAVRENPEAGLIILTSPTYEGVVSDIKAICDIAHRHSIPVLVDSAHGAHFGFSEYFPPNPVSCGADIVVASLHKTLPALTQCALLHVSGGLIDEGRLASELAVFQTSSPSYVLLSSIDRCLRLLDGGGETLFTEYQKNLEAFDGIISGIEKLRVLCHGADTLENHGVFFGFDPGKIVVSTRSTNLTGHELARLLRSKYRIEPEMAYSDYTVAMTSICDSRDAMTQLARALLDADREAEAGVYGNNPPAPPPPPLRLVTAAEAAGIKGEYRPLEKAAGAMSLEYVWSHPPGIPFIVPGELIDDCTIAFLKQSAGAGIALKSTKGRIPQEIYCAPASDACNSCFLF